MISGPESESTSKLGHPTICHFSSVQRWLDARTFHMQCPPLLAKGYGTHLVAPHGFDCYKRGVKLVHFPSPQNRLARILFAPSILFSVLRQRADLYQFHNPELLPVGLLLKLVFRKRVVYDAEEDFPSMMGTKPWIPRLLRPLVAKAVDIMERLVAACIDGVITADPLTLKRVASVGRSKKLVFFNFPNLDFFPNPPSGPKPFDVVYRGGLSDRTGIPVLLESLRILTEDSRPARVLLIGYFDDPRSKELILRRIRDLGLERWIELRGRIEHHAMAGALSQARVGVCPLQPIPKFLRNIPVKVWEYWACGLPVVATDLPPMRPFFRDREYGFLVKPDDAAQMAEAIGWLLDHPDEATKMGERGRHAVKERYNNEREAAKLAAFYRNLLDRDSPRPSSR